MSKTNKIGKNAQKGVTGAVIAGVVVGIKMALDNHGVPDDTGTSICVGASGLLWAIWNWFKHR